MIRFKERIRNWARVYRDRQPIGESNLMPILRELRLQRGLPDEEQKKAHRVVSTDESDADLLDQAFKRLEATDKYLLSQYWLFHVSERTMAKRMGVYLRQCDRWLEQAERRFKYVVETIEKKGYNDDRKTRKFCRL